MLTILAMLFISFLCALLSVNIIFFLSHSLARFLYNSSLFVACFDIFIASASVDDSIAHFCFNALMHSKLREIEKWNGQGRGSGGGEVTYRCKLSKWRRVVWQTF